MSKAKRKILTELKQLKVRQKCAERNITWPIKLNDLEDDELEFLKAVEKMKTDNDKNFKNSLNEAKTSVQECLKKVHNFQNTIASYDEDVLASRPSDLLKIMAEINILLSENLYICSKELASLKYQNEHNC
ncbi:hypothetical protein PVAND_003536 [Polypedilum vanderplanki]|uniref:Uncharacterized protein n=1 Tax=Polypedilum vanderplanki TaxID=319348 RepID=A0A9J6BUC9_POLVA|nr:hypothetical protein PVAND_003536 [Polypedilum vanderplanki]